MIATQVYKMLPTITSAASLVTDQRLIYRDPRLQQLGVSLEIYYLCTQSGAIESSVYVQDDTDYDTDLAIAPYRENLGSLKTALRNGSVKDTAEAMLHGIKRQVRKYISSQDRRIEHIKEVYEPHQEYVPYAVGLIDTARRILGITTPGTMTIRYADAIATIRPGVDLKFKQINGEPTMLVEIDTACPIPDFLKTVELLNDKGYNIASAEYTGGEGEVHVRMGLLTGYREEIFTDLQKTRIFTRQLVNEMEEL